MTWAIRPYAPSDYQRVLDICIAAFTPIHEGFERALGPKIFALQYDGWRERYGEDIKRLTSSAPVTLVHVIEDGGMIAGFVTTTIDEKAKAGEIGLNAVDPAYQGRGAGKALYEFALRELKQRGAEVAYVGAGADAAHAPARAAYEAVGFDRSLPTVWYFKTL